MSPLQWSWLCYGHFSRLTPNAALRAGGITMPEMNHKTPNSKPSVQKRQNLKPLTMKTTIKTTKGNNNTFAAFQKNVIKKQQTTQIKGGIGSEDGIDI